MPRYNVTISARIEVEAANEDEAREAANEIITNSEYLMDFTVLELPS